MVSLAFTRQIVKNLGPDRDVPEPDLMTNAEGMLWMLDKYEAIKGARKPGFISDKLVGMGGSQGRIEAAGYEVMIAQRKVIKELDRKIESTSANFQGFGKVAQHAFQLYQLKGGKVVFVSCWYPIENENFLRHVRLPKSLTTKVGGRYSRGLIMR